MDDSTWMLPQCGLCLVNWLLPRAEDAQAGPPAFQAVRGYVGLTGCLLGLGKDGAAYVLEASVD